VALDRVEEFARAEFVLATIDGAARVFAPLFAGTLFFVGGKIAMISHKASIS
jgi:hypothetical protein